MLFCIKYTYYSVLCTAFQVVSMVRRGWLADSALCPVVIGEKGKSESKLSCAVRQ